MKKSMLLLPVSLLALATACDRPSSENKQAIKATNIYAASSAELTIMRSQFAKIEMDTDVSFLTEEEIAVINKLNEVADLMSEIYFRQRSEDNPYTRKQIVASSLPQSAQLLDLFDLHFGPWDILDANKPFYGDTRLPPGSAFYPADITRQEFEDWIEAHPEDEAQFRSRYTVIRRSDDNQLKAIPYSEHYRQWLEPAATRLREAADITSNESLERFLNERADAFLSNNYFKSELAWMDVDASIEVAIGPYAVYGDRLFGYKTAFVAFVAIKNPSESATLAKYKSYLQDMEEHLPVAEKYKNYSREFNSPILVANQVYAGGNNRPGPQAIAFNLPNDERVQEIKGAKKVLLNNVLGAKFDRILSPMAEKVLVSDQAGLVEKKHMATEVLFHELSHSIGPGRITVDETETTVNAQLRELYSPIEEGKSDVLGAYNTLFMMERGELPKEEKEEFLATYFVGIFRPMRFGLDAPHAKGAAFQYTYFKNANAFVVEDGKYRIDFPALEKAITSLVSKVIIIQGNGDYNAAADFLENNGAIDEDARTVLEAMSELPVDIQPIYKKKM